MRYIHLIILGIIFFSPQLWVQALDRNNLIRVDIGSKLEYRIGDISYIAAGPSFGHVEYFALLAYESIDSVNINHIKSEADFFNHIHNNDHILYFNHSGEIVNDSNEKFKVNPYYPRAIVVVVDWQYFRNFGSIYQYAFNSNLSDSLSISYSYEEDNEIFSINMASTEELFFGDTRSNRTIGNSTTIKMSYDLKSGILLSLNRKVTNFNETRKDYSYSLQMKHLHLSQSLINYDELFNKADGLFSIPIEQTIAYSLLLANIVIYIYLDRKKWNKSWRSNLEPDHANNFLDLSTEKCN